MIIAFGHRKQQGKDTVVNAILQHVNSTKVFDNKPQLRIVIRSFADPLYEICTKMVPEFQGKQYYDRYPKAKEKVIARIGSSPRGMLIGIGQTMKTIIGPDCFAVALMNSISDNEITLIPDLRFPCEVEAIQARGGKCVKVVRPDVEKTDDYADCALDDFHDWDHTIYNTGSLAELEFKARDVYKEIMKDA